VMGDRPGLARDDVLLAVTTVSFDIAGLEIYLPLTRGARLVLAEDADIADGRRLAALLRDCGATVMQATPSTWQMLLSAGWEGNPALKLRVFVTGGGCSGFQYGFTFDENSEEGDTRVVNEGVTLLVDPMSFQYLAGAEIDYSEGLEGAQFVIRNPNATTTCGCGSSFTV